MDVCKRGGLSGLHSCCLNILPHAHRSLNRSRFDKGEKRRVRKQKNVDREIQKSLDHGAPVTDPTPTLANPLGEIFAVVPHQTKTSGTPSYREITGDKIYEAFLSP